MEAAITALVGLLQTAAPFLGTASSIGKVISVLVEILPVLAKEINDVKPMVANIISALRANPATTADQLSALDTLEARIDAEFDAAAKAALDEDAAAKN